MVSNILSPLFRQRKRNKVYAVINILGLSIAITVAILIYGFVVKEIQTDSFHKNGKNIYRVLNTEDGSFYQAGECGLFGSTIQSQVAGIEAYARIWPMTLKLKTEQTQESEIRKQCIFTDTSFFNFFTFPLAKGIVDTQSSRQWAVISEKMAQQLFGSQDPVGKNIHVTDEDWDVIPETYQIVAIMKDIPAWSTIQTDIVLDYRAVEKLTDWRNNYSSIYYLQLNPKVSIKEIEKNIQNVYEPNAPLGGKIKLQPLLDIYYAQEQIECDCIAPKGSLTFTRLLIGITLLILLLSSGNYMTIKIAEGVHQVKVFSIQRCFGANNFIVWKHFFKETTFYFVISGMIAILLAWGLFPYFLNIISPQFYYPYPINAKSIIGFLFLLGIFITFISSVLSYYFLRRIYAKGIKNNMEKKNTIFDIRKVLITASIAIFCMLSVDSFIAYKQMNLLKNKDLGCNYQNTIELEDFSKEIKNLFYSNPHILSVARGVPLPLTESDDIKLICSFEKSGEMKNKAEALYGDADYLNTWQIKLLEGENFNPNIAPKEYAIVPVLVNQEFVKQAQLKHAVGTIFKCGEDQPTTSLQIIGVVKNFNARLLYDQIEPLCIFYTQGAGTGIYNTDGAFLRHQPGKKAEVIQFLRENDLPFNDTQHVSYYDKEKAFIRLININTLLAIFIGGLGIFAFSVFFANSRKKEVALRKINGGSEWEIQKLFNWEFIRLTLYACIISIPLAFYFIHFWLEKFAYRVTIEWYFFLLAVLVCLAFVILVITWQIRKIANINPVKCLREL